MGPPSLIVGTHVPILRTLLLACLLISTLTQPLIISYFFLVSCSSVYTTTRIPLSLILYHIGMSVGPPQNAKKKVGIYIVSALLGSPFTYCVRHTFALISP